MDDLDDLGRQQLMEEGLREFMPEEEDHDHGDDDEYYYYDPRETQFKR